MIKRPLKFRMWDKVIGKMLPDYNFINFDNDEYAFMQYTGTNDRNGKEIYEGDFLEYAGGLRYLVSWNPTYFCWDFRTVTNQDGMYDIPRGHISESMVQGNIFETPHLQDAY